MKRSTPVIAALVVLLLLSNAFWLYQSVDERIGAGLELGRQREALTQVFALIPVVAQKANRARIIATAADKTSNNQAYEKDGYVWVGSLGLKFAGTGELVEVVTAFPMRPPAPEGRNADERSARHTTGIMPTP